MTLFARLSEKVNTIVCRLIKVAWRVFFRESNASRHIILKLNHITFKLSKQLVITSFFFFCPLWRQQLSVNYKSTLFRFNIFHRFHVIPHDVKGLGLHFITVPLKLRVMPSLPALTFFFNWSVSIAYVITTPLAHHYCGTKKLFVWHNFFNITDNDEAQRE